MEYARNQKDEFQARLALSAGLLAANAYCIPHRTSQNFIEGRVNGIGHLGKAGQYIVRYRYNIISQYMKIYDKAVLLLVYIKCTVNCHFEHY